MDSQQPTKGEYRTLRRLVEEEITRTGPGATQPQRMRVRRLFALRDKLTGLCDQRRKPRKAPDAH